MDRIDTNRRTVLRTVGSGGATVGLGAVGTVGAREGASGDDTIVDVAVAVDGFDVLVAAVVEAGLVDALSGTRQLTVFAPIDEAFEAAGITADNVDQVDDETLVGVLTYHVAPGRRYASSVVEAPMLPTLNGEAIDVDGTTLNGGQADIVATDIEASNGVIHAIDGVLLPSGRSGGPADAPCSPSSSALHIVAGIPTPRSESPPRGRHLGRWSP